MPIDMPDEMIQKIEEQMKDMNAKVQLTYRFRLYPNEERLLETLEPCKGFQPSVTHYFKNQKNFKN